MLVITKVIRDSRGRLEAAQVAKFDAKGSQSAMQTVPAFLLPANIHGSIHVGMMIEGELTFSFKVGEPAKEVNVSHLPKAGIPIHTYGFKL